MKMHPNWWKLGVTAVIYYDAVGRVIKTELPDGSLTRVEFDSWKQSSFDQNDTVLESQWYIDRGSPDPDIDLPSTATKKELAAWKAAKHAHTPSSVYLDSLGRPVLSIEHNGKDSAGNNRFVWHFYSIGY